MRMPVRWAIHMVRLKAEGATPAEIDKKAATSMRFLDEAALGAGRSEAAPAAPEVGAMGGERTSENPESGNEGGEIPFPHVVGIAIRPHELFQLRYETYADSGPTADT